MANLKPIEINKDTLVFFISNWDNEYTDFNTKRILWQNIEKLLKELKSKYNNIFSFFIPWWFKCGTEQYNLLNKYSKVTTILANTLEEVNFYKSNNFQNTQKLITRACQAMERCYEKIDDLNAEWNEPPTFNDSYGFKSRVNEKISHILEYYQVSALKDTKESEKTKEKTE